MQIVPLDIAAFYKLFAGPFGPWLPFGVAIILLASAAWDARTGIVPNVMLLPAAVAIIVGRFIAKGFPDALTNLALGLGIWAVIWAMNEGWYRLFKKDAIGMGDAKWTALAAATFGAKPALFSWFIGSWVSIVWIGFCYIIGSRIKKVYFAPFLFVGLMIALCFARKIFILPDYYNIF